MFQIMNSFCEVNYTQHEWLSDPKNRQMKTKHNKADGRKRGAGTKGGIYDT